MNVAEPDALKEHERFMRRCIELAKVAHAAGNAPVGAIVVVDGQVVGEGIEVLPAGNNITGHAEVIACQSAVDRTGSRLLHGATIYTTAEPCFMCSYVVRQCAVALVVYGVETPGIGGITSSHPILTDATITRWTSTPHVLGGVLLGECQQLMPT
jgi:tRNA(adenine34) deaminase